MSTIFAPSESYTPSRDKPLQIESDFLKLGLFSLRRQGVQLNLGLFAGTTLALLATALVIFGFRNVDGELVMWRNILLGVGIVASLVGMLTIARSLTTGARAVALEVWIRRMGQGDLDYKVEMEGNDEITAIAESLEELRQRSIRVVRLNLVEKLAQDLEAKNAELEDVLDQLRSAQDQIVTRQKLAELGELAAGVAHEIKNPLNFVHNFAGATNDLIIELKDELEDDQREDIAEIIDDIAENLARVEVHASRADRIIDDMLNLGGHGGNFQATDINELVSYSADLAYNGSKNLHPDLELELEHDLDPEVGEITVVAEDVGRVILNIVNNSCYAIDEKRLSLAGEGVSFTPSISLHTERKSDSVEIRIRDNGTGIEPEVVDKIFNPFFTTKPTNQGTGLGLSIANDIIRQHGGTIETATRIGEFTEMVVSLPLAAANEGDDERDSEGEGEELAVGVETA